MPSAVLVSVWLCGAAGRSGSRSRAISYHARSVTSTTAGTSISAPARQPRSLPKFIVKSDADAAKASKHQSIKALHFNILSRRLTTAHGFAGLRHTQGEQSGWLTFRLPALTRRGFIAVCAHGSSEVLVSKVRRCRIILSRFVHMTLCQVAFCPARPIGLACRAIGPGSQGCSTAQCGLH